MLSIHKYMHTYCITNMILYDVLTIMLMFGLHFKIILHHCLIFAIVTTYVWLIYLTNNELKGSRCTMLMLSLYVPMLYVQLYLHTVCIHVTHTLYVNSVFITNVCMYVICIMYNMYIIFKLQFRIINCIHSMYDSMWGMHHMYVHTVCHVCMYTPRH
jgi:hypothetical protein